VEAFLDHGISLVGVNLAAEINLGAGRQCGVLWWPGVVEFYNGVYSVVKGVLTKRAGSSVLVFPSIQLESLMGVQSGQACASFLSGASPSPALLACISAGLKLVDPLMRDAFGISSYPPMTSGAPAPAWYIPSVLNLLTSQDRASFLVAETGWNRVPMEVNLANGTEGVGREVSRVSDPPLDCALLVNSSLALANAWLESLIKLGSEEQWKFLTWWSDKDLLYQDSLSTCPCTVPPGFQSSCTFISAFREIEELAGGQAVLGEVQAKAFGAMGLRSLDGNTTLLWETLQAARGKR